jgi:glycosyltransferase involved in cell wall biosynthesis
MTITDAPPRISVVIPHLNQPDHLRRCLASLFAGRLVPDEVIVVDNGSREMPVSVCDAFPGVQLLSEAKPGPGPARNRGVLASSGDILAFIDADCLADPLWLHSARQAMSDPKAQILGGDVRIAYADPDRLTTLECYESIYAYRMDRYIAREGFTGTGNLVVRRDVLDKVGPFAGLEVAEDRDWGQRATRSGHRILYVAGMKVYHPARPNFRDLAVKWERATAHDFVHAGRRPDGKLRFLLKTLAMPISPLVEIPRLLASDRLSSLGNKARAFLCLVRIRLRRAAIMARLLAGTDPATFSGAWNRPKG